MLPEKIKALAAVRVRVLELERAIASDLKVELAQLPAKFGFKDTASFIAALRRSVNSHKGRHGSAPAARNKRRRARITDTIRSRVRELVEEGETGAAIAKRVGISIPSVQNIKKALGLVKRRVP